jgi:phospholipid/cholesterol/gamma-HCH transport system substrate-binding protein
MSETGDASIVTEVVRRLRFKVGLLAILTLILLAGFVGYALYARGVFEPTQRLVLLTDNAEGVSVGMSLTYGGFPIGRVARIRLGDDGKARIRIEVPTSDALWLRTSSVFTLERSIVGGARLRAFSGNLGDPPLPDRAVRVVLRGDATEEIPQLVANLRGILANVERMTGQNSSLSASLGNVQAVTERMAGKHGALEAALGTPENAAKVIAMLERTNALLASMQGVTAKVDGAVARADSRVSGAGGVLEQAQQAGVRLNSILGEARDSLKKADAVLANAQVASENAKLATTDLATMRAEVDANLRKIGSLIDEVNRKWPFERDTELRLP